MIRIDSTMLDRAVKAVAHVAEKRSSLPILSHVLVSGNGRLEFTATDLEIGVRTWLDVPSESDFSVCLPGHAFKDIIGNSAGEIEISLGEFNRAKLSSASGVRVLGGMDAADYPAWMDRQGANDCIVTTKDFVSVMKKAVQSCDTGRNARFNLNGVLLDGPAGSVVSTDGHRAQKIPVGWIPETVKAIIPATGLKAALTTLGKFKDVHELTLWFEDKNIWITSEVFEITIRLIDGEYPQYEKVIPERREDDAITANTKEFIKAVRQVRIMADKNDTMELWPKLEGALILRCMSYMGSAQTEIDAATFGAYVPQRIELDAKYVLDAARKCETDTIKLWLNPDGAACFIGEELVMPKRETVCPLPKPERVTSAPVFVPSGIPITPHPTYPGKPQDKKWAAKLRPGRQNQSHDDSKIYARLAVESPIPGPVVVNKPAVKRQARVKAPTLPKDIIHDWLADVDETVWEWTWAKSPRSKYAGTWKPKTELRKAA